MLMDTRPSRGSGDAQPWRYEPNRVAWRDLATGLQCLILRHPMGHLCGYVRVPRDHPLHGKHQRQRCVWRLRVHGGITFTGCLRNRKMKRGHWLGFDCAHAYDFVPGMDELRRLLPPITAASLFNGWRDRSEVYRDIDYVRDECTQLAAQVAHFYLRLMQP